MSFEVTDPNTLLGGRRPGREVSIPFDLTPGTEDPTPFLWNSHERVWYVDVPVIDIHMFYGVRTLCYL